MSDDLVISGGGSIAVATDELFTQQKHLSSIGNELGDCLGRLRAIDRLVGQSRLVAVDAPLSAMRAERSIDDATAALVRARDRATGLASALEAAASAYGAIESVEAHLAQQLSADLAYQLGFWAPLLGLLAAPLLIATAVGGGVGGAIGVAIAPESARKQGGREITRATKSLLNDPRFVAFLRLAVSSTDDLGEGLFKMPPGLHHLLGDEGLGLLGVGSSAAVVAAIASAGGVLRETGVSVTAEKGRKAPPPPASFADRADRIPTGAAEIRIDRYQEAGQPDRFEVYLGGTVDTSLVASTEPWDMTSNITAMAGGDAGSYEAARQAMAAAGIDASTPVVLNGYSQGGLLAALLASSGDYDTRGLFTLGGPCAGVAVPHDIPYVAIEHREDLVPALGGVWKSSEPVLVSRGLFDGQPDLSDRMLPAHELSNYRETARLADSSVEERLATAGDALRQFDGDLHGSTTMLYRAKRLDPG